MRIVTFSQDNTVCHGTLDGDRIQLHPSATSAWELAMQPGAHPARGHVAREGVTLLAPVPRPGKVVCIGLNYRAHAEEGGNALPDYPAVFLRGATSLVGPQAPLILLYIYEKVYFES